jgi:hypothetical protein
LRKKLAGRASSSARLRTKARRAGCALEFAQRLGAWKPGAQGRLDGLGLLDAELPGMEIAVSHRQDDDS